ncbi:DoxX family protein [Microbacterium sp. ASV49]|uniref:DoxX family protein n=1 Tax=Microbacterium candidum TaxID=3041922 RepID=A0ABT7MZ99_9MICO|nr:DoxX family protein [Microbacterium sp. ASV49]MDL9979779.1 DoxX family protein [Microbacterium sp. ASV49]
MTTIPVRTGAVTTAAPTRESAFAKAMRLEAQLEGGVKTLLERWSIPMLRIALGLVFLVFGVLKFLPGVSPIEALVARTWNVLSFGMVTGYPALAITAAMESLVGILLVVGAFQRFALALLAVTFVGILSPLVFFTGDLFTPAPTLTAQYILKDVVLVCAALVVASRALKAAPKKS